MDAGRFDRGTRAFSVRLPRRRLAGAFGLTGILLPVVGEARRRKKPKIKFNAFGCVNVGNACKTSEQCCSGSCAGKKRKKRCVAHGADVCKAGDQFVGCGGAINVDCTSSDGIPGFCNTTTGNAGFCTNVGACTRCTRDADCVTFCGPQAACVLCDNCPDGIVTSCVGPGSCDFSAV